MDAKPELAVLVAAFEVMTNVDARAGAVLMLGKYGRAAVPTLLKATQDREGMVRAFAAEALGEIRSPDTIGDVVRLLSDADPGVRYAAVQSLGVFGDRTVVAKISALGTDPEEVVRQKAAEVLAHLSKE